MIAPVANYSDHQQSQQDNFLFPVIWHVLSPKAHGSKSKIDEWN